MKTRSYKHICGDIENVENYDKASADNFKGWICHHRLETHNSDGERRPVDLLSEELMALGIYYHRPTEELIFLTIKEHRCLHNKAFKGKKTSEETKRKNSEAHKDKHHSKETKKKISETMKNKPAWNKGKHLSEDERKRLHWFNNGSKNIRTETCPDGFVPGRLK